MQEVTTIDRARSALQAALDAALAATRSLPPGSMLKFYSTLLLLPLLLVALGYGAYWTWDWWHESRLAREFVVPSEINPYLTHPLQSNSAYVLADALIAARSESAVAERLLDVFRAIHLGVYRADGTQVLAGSERSAQDIFLYDVERRMLARGFRRRNFISFDDHSRMLGVGLLQLDKPEPLTPLLRRAVLRRYQAAVKQPGEPQNFLILLVDGLARHKPKPYSLAEIESRPGTDLYLDPLQSFLIMLDFFSQPPKPVPTPSGQLRWLPWNWVTTAHAEEPCASVKGDDSEGRWGAGKDGLASGVQAGAELAKLAATTPEVVGKIAENVSRGAEVMGTAGDASNAFSDLVKLYGLQIRVTSEPRITHLRHAGDKPVIKFDVWVTLDTGDPSDGPIRCGRMAGQVPGGSAQPLKDMEVTWNVTPDWPPYLTVAESSSDMLARKPSGGAMGLKTSTDENGHSSFVLEAGDCPGKSGSAIARRPFFITATVRFINRKMSTAVAPGVEGPLATISLLAKLPPGAVQYVIGGRTGLGAFTLEWHTRRPQRRQYGQ